MTWTDLVSANRLESARNIPLPPAMRNPFHYINSSPEVIRLTVVMLFERGIATCHEAVRFWWNRFGPIFAAEIKKKRSAGLRVWPQRRWHLDEVCVKINGRTHYQLL